MDKHVLIEEDDLFRLSVLEFLKNGILVVLTCSNSLRYSVLSVRKKVGIGQVNLASILLKDDTRCFALLAGDELMPPQRGR